MSTQTPAIRNGNRKSSECCQSGTVPIDGVESPAPKGCRKIRLSVGGMTCGGCAARIESALSAVSGVASVSVDVTSGTVTVRCDPEAVDPEQIRSAVAAAGYEVGGGQEARARLRKQRFHPKPYLYGLSVALAAMTFYLVLITATSDWYNAKMQISDYRWWLTALAAGLGVQVSLYTVLRRRMRGSGLKAANRSVAASGGMSTAAMAVCCSHYLAVFLPLIGLPFLSAAAAGLERYQAEFFAVGVAFNIVGIVLMARQLKRNDIPLKAALG